MTQMKELCRDAEFGERRRRQEANNRHQGGEFRKRAIALTAEFHDLSRYQPIAETTVVSSWVFLKICQDGCDACGIGMPDRARRLDINAR
jgi:hypothetical protein